MVPWFSFAQSGRAVQAWRGDKDGARSPRMSRHRSGGFGRPRSFDTASIRLPCVFPEAIHSFQCVLFAG